MIVLVCLLSCSFDSTGSLIFAFAVNGTGALYTANVLIKQCGAATKFLETKYKPR